MNVFIIGWSFAKRYQVENTIWLIFVQIYDVIAMDTDFNCVKPNKGVKDLPRITQRKLERIKLDNVCTNVAFTI